MRQMLSLPDDVIKHLQSKIEKGITMSGYITGLVRQDMSNTSLDEKIRQIVAEIFKDKNISIQNTSDESINDSVKNILNI